MKWNAVGAVVVGLLTIPALLLAEHRPSPGLAVRIYNNVGIAPHELRVATLEAESILQAAGVTVSFMECWHRDAEPAMASDTCRQPLSANALTLRLPAAASTPKGKIVSMGYSLVQLNDRAPFLATVYSDLVGSVARNANIDPLPLLGRAIAHEIGHLLLNTTSHANAGLMREKWTRTELQKNDPVDWEFRDQDTQIMRSAVSTRLSEASR
jgi:hypothetical protein